MQHVEVRKLISAPLQSVWDRYTDHRSWTQWAGLGTVELERHGVPPPNGVGCVRVISNLGLTVSEEILTFEPPRRMSYRLVRGFVPMKDHLGEVLFEERDGGTLITWRCQFNSTLPGLGGVLRLLIAPLFGNALDALARTFQ